MNVPIVPVKCSDCPLEYEDDWNRPRCIHPMSITDYAPEPGRCGLFMAPIHAPSQPADSGDWHVPRDGIYPPGTPFKYSASDGAVGRLVSVRTDGPFVDNPYYYGQYWNGRDRSGAMMKNTVAGIRFAGPESKHHIITEEQFLAEIDAIDAPGTDEPEHDRTCPKDQI